MSGPEGEFIPSHDPLLDRPLWTRRLPAELVESEKYFPLFLEGCRSHARLNHENVLGLLDVKEQDGEYCLVLHRSGPSLAEILSQRQLEVHERQSLLEDLLKALDYAHQHGVIHGGLCPENLRQHPDGSWKVWGFVFSRWEKVARMVASGFRPHDSFLYQSAEQLRGMKIDGRADLCSFALVMYRVWCGPIGAVHQELSPLLTHLLELELPLDGVPEPLASIMRDCLKKRPEERPATVEEVMRSLGLGSLVRVEQASVLRTRAAEILIGDRWEGARDLLIRAVQLDPQDHTALNDLGVASLSSGNRIEAERCLKAAARLCPAEFAIHFNLGLIYSELQWSEQAEAAFRKARELNPDISPKRGSIKEPLLLIPRC